MNIAATVLNDYKYWDDLEAITLVNNFAPQWGNDTSLAIPSAMRRQPTYKELAVANGAYTGQDLVWLIPSVVIPGGYAPKISDIVQDAAGHQWTVLEESLDDVGSVYRLVTRNMIIVHQLSDTIMIEQPAVSYDAAGAVLRAYPSDATPGGTNLYSNLACRIQPIESVVAEERGLRGQRTKYMVYLSQQLDPTQFDARECRVFWPDGALHGTDVYLDIERYANSARLDELPYLEVTGKL